MNTKLLLVITLLLAAPAWAVEPVEERDPGNWVSGNLASDVTDTTATTVISAQGTGVKVCLRNVLITNGSTSVNTRVDVLDGSTVKSSGFAFANGDGWSTRFDPPICGTANTAWRIQAGTTSAALRATMTGFKMRR